MENTVNEKLETYFVECLDHPETSRCGKLLGEIQEDLRKEDHSKEEHSKEDHSKKEPDDA